MSIDSSAVMVTLAFVVFGCGGEVTPEEAEAETAEHALYYEAGNTWPWGNVPVCWVDFEGTTAERRAWVRDAVEDAWERAASIDFTGWGQCGHLPAYTVSIAVNDYVVPNSHVGVRSRSYSGSMQLNFFDVTRDLDGDGSLDFADCNNDAGPFTDVLGQTWVSRRHKCVANIAVHEFGHALGLAHEQNRHDTPGSCTEDDDGTGDTAIGYWDRVSIMNYCAPIWNNAGLLSATDISGIQALYGHDSNDYVWWMYGNIRDIVTATPTPPPALVFDGESYPVAGHYNPLAGDFDGDGADDIFWHQPGPGMDNIWWGGLAGSFQYQNGYSEQDDEYQPLVGDFDGNGGDDIFWYRPGPATDYVWWSERNRRFWIEAVPVNGYYTPLVGDFDGDGLSDIFWYRPGSLPEIIWWGRYTRRFTKQNGAENVRGTYVPLVGNFDADNGDDIIWYRAGTPADFVWWSDGDRTFTKRNVTINGTYDPAIGDFDGNGTDDIIWNQESTSTDPHWLWTPHRRTYVSGVSPLDGDYTPIVGDFDGSGTADVFWYGG